jgi:hypothetical protein
MYRRPEVRLEGVLGGEKGREDERNMTIECVTERKEKIDGGKLMDV